MRSRARLRLIQGGRAEDTLPPRWRSVADAIVACGESISTHLAAGHWSKVARLVEERRTLLLDLRGANLDSAGRRCVQALEASIEESEAMIVYLASARASAGSRHF
jgi:hypothetical protein